MKEKADIHYKEGKSHLLISAPHVHRHKRPNYSGAYKQPEPWTDVIGESVADQTGAHFITIKEQLDYDPNFHPLERNPYKQKLDEIISSKGIKYIIDLHGLSDEHSFDMGIFYSKRYYKSKQIAYELTRSVNNGMLKEALFQIILFNDDYQETISEFCVNNYQVVAIQIEIARYIRDDAKLRNVFIENLSKYLIGL
jgi:hypothetical protein